MTNQNLPRFKRLAKEGSWIVIGQIMSVAASLVLVRVLTEHLNPAQYGQLALGLTVAGLVSQVVMGGIGNAISRFYSIAAEKQDLHGYLRASRRLMIYATVAVLVIGLVLMGGLFWLRYTHWLGLAAAALVFSLLGAYNASLSGIQNAARQRAVVAFHGGLDGWLKILLAVGVMLWLGNSSTAVVIGYACSSLVVTGSQFIFLRRLIKHQSKPSGADNQWMRQMWAFLWPFLATNAFGWAQQSSARWALEIYTTTESVGLYSVLSQLGYTPIQTVTGFVMTFLTPILFARTGDANCTERNKNVRELTNKLAMLGLSLTGCAFIVAMLLHSYIFKLFVNSKYLLVSQYLPYLVLSGGIFAVAQLYAIRLQALFMMDKLVSSGIIISLFGVFLSFFGIRIAGVLGAVTGSLIFSASYLILMWYWFFKKS
ncbi:MAG: lipopolysaccharide biosynthesis protein [Methylococcaceae bacterium]